MRYRRLASMPSAWFMLSSCSHFRNARDEGTIRAADLVWASDWASGDVEKIVSHYADDAVVGLPGWQPLVGKSALRAGIQKMLGPQFDVRLRFTPQGSAGGLGTTRRGTYSQFQSPPQKSGPIRWTTEERGPYIVDYRKLADGSFVVTQQRCIYNSEPILPSWFQTPGSEDIYPPPKPNDGRLPG